MLKKIGGSFRKKNVPAEAAPDASAVSASDEAHTVAQEPGSATPPVAEEDVARPQSNDAACTAVVTVRVMKAVDLVAKDRGGTSDPLVQLVLGSQTRETKIIPKTLNPEWDEVFRLNFTPNVGQTLDVVVYDHDKGLLSNSKEFLGSATVHLDHIMPDMDFQEWYPLEYNPTYQKKKEDVTGKILLDVFWSEDGEAAQERIRPFAKERSSTGVGASKALLEIPEDEEVGASRPVTSGLKRKAIVSILKAENLIAKDSNGLSDPFLEVHLGEQKVHTKHVPKTLNPEWSESFTLDVPEGEDELELVVFDFDKGFFSNAKEYMGSCKVSLADIEPGTGSQQMWIPLEHEMRWQQEEQDITGQVLVEIEVFEEQRLRGAGLSINTFKSHLSITVLRAEGLLPKDKGGTSDPFVELRIEKQKFKTKVQPKTLEPEWNEIFECECDVAGTNLDVIVHDHDATIFGGASEYLGSVTIPLQFAHAGAQWYTLEWDSKFSKKKEVITGRIMLDIAGLEGGGGDGDGSGGPPSLLKRESSRLVSDTQSPSSIGRVQARVIEVTIVKGTELVAKDKGGTSDPFIEARLGKQRFKSKVVKKSLSPEWNEKFKFDYSPTDPKLALVVYDEDKGFLGGSSAEYMGSCDINLDSLVLGEEVSEWYPLKFDSKYQKNPEKITGRLLVKLRMTVDDTAGVDVSKLSRPARNERKAWENKERGMGWIEVTVVSADRLRAADRGGSSDPYVILSCGAKRERTKTKKKTLQPHWDEAFAFEVQPGLGGIELTVYDEDNIGSDSFLGSLVVRLDDLPENSDVVQSFALQARGLDPDKDPYHAAGSLKLLLNYFVKGASVVQVPTYDEDLWAAKYATTGYGVCTICVICAANLPLVDVKSGDIQTYVEMVAGESKVVTKVMDSRCPVWNTPFLLEVSPASPVVELAVKAKPSKLNVTKGDTILGVATILLADLPHDLASSWHDLVPLKASYGTRASIKVTTQPHILPELPLNYPRRQVARIRESASKGLGTLELVVVSAQQLVADPGTGVRTAVATVFAGNRKGVIDGFTKSLNPVWNKPLSLEIDPDVVSFRVELLDKEPSTIAHKFIGSCEIPFEHWGEGDEVDAWYTLIDENGLPTKSRVRIWGCYVQKISYIDPAERGITQGAIGDVEVVCIAARGVGLPKRRRGGMDNNSNSSPKSPATPSTPAPKTPKTPGTPAQLLTRQSSAGSAKSGKWGEEEEEEDSRFTLEKGTMLKCEARIGIMRRMTAAAKPTPNPLWNETLHLKVPHPTAVLQVGVLVESFGDLDLEPWATAEIALADLKDSETSDSWYPLVVTVKTKSPGIGGSPKAGKLSQPSSPTSRRAQPGSFKSAVGSEWGAGIADSSSVPDKQEVIVGSIQLRITIRRNYGFNLDLLSGLMACPWRCGTSFVADDAQAHFLICPLAPDPTAEVQCIHLGLGCKFKGPRFGMKDHLAICPFEPVKDVVRGYVKELRELRKSLQHQDDEINVLRGKVQELEAAQAGRPQAGQEAHERYTLEREANEAIEDDPKMGTGVLDVETSSEAMHRKIIKWTPQHNSITLQGHTDGVTCLAHSVQYKKLFSGALDRTIRVWDLSFHEPLCDGELKGHRGGVTGLAVSQNKLVSGSADMTVKVWDLATMRDEVKLSGHQGLIHGVILLTNMCFTVSQDKSIKIWDIRGGELVTSIETKSRGQYGMAIHELKLLSASGSKIYSWDLRKTAASTMNEQQRMEFGRFDTLTGNASGVFGHQMVGDRLYTSAVDNSVRLWDLRSLQVKSKIVGHSDFVRALATAGERLITASDDKTIRVWDLEFHDCAKVLKGHSSYVNALVCARARLFSASMDRTIKIWE